MNMDLSAFEASLQQERPATAMPAALRALWWDHKGAWHEAHACVQEDESDECAWVHAFLHRREGDPENAAYWYRRAKRPVATGSLESERADIARALLARA